MNGRNCTIFLRSMRTRIHEIRISDKKRFMGRKKVAELHKLLSSQKRVFWFISSCHCFIECSPGQPESCKIKWHRNGKSESLEAFIGCRFTCRYSTHAHCHRFHVMFICFVLMIHVLQFVYNFGTKRRSFVGVHCIILERNFNWIDFLNISKL